MTNEKKAKRPIDILKSPIIVILSIVIGVAVGLLSLQSGPANPFAAAAPAAKNAVAIMAPLGDFYLNFIQMSVIPILITAIVSSLASLLRHKAASRSIGKLVLVTLLFIILSGLFGMACGYLGRPGEGLDAGARKVLGAEVNKQGGVLEMELVPAKEEAAPAKQSGFLDFLLGLAPKNIFNSLSFGYTLQLVFFSIIFGIALGFIRKDAATQLIGLTQATLEAFQKLIVWAMYMLPFGLICLLAKQISVVGIDVFGAMLRFIVLFWAGGFLVFLLVTVVIWVKSGVRNPFRVLKALFDPIMISLATRQSLAALPSAIDSLEEKLGFEGTVVNLTMPLGITIGRYGNIFFFALASFFVIQLYGIPLDLQGYLMVFAGSIFAGIATAGASGIATLSVIGIVLAPLGLPVEAILVILMAIDPIVDPMRTFLLVYVNMCVSSLVAGKASSEPLPEEAAFAGALAREAAAPASPSEVPFEPEIPAMAGAAPGGEWHLAPEAAERPAPFQGEKPEPGRRPLVAAFPAIDSPPYVYRDADGELAGIEAEVAREIARRLGRDFVADRSAADKEGLLDLLASGGADIAMARFTRPEQREQRAAFSDPYISVARRGSRDYVSVALSRRRDSVLRQVNEVLSDLHREGFTRELVEKNKEMRA